MVNNNHRRCRANGEEGVDRQHRVNHQCNRDSSSRGNQGRWDLEVGHRCSRGNLDNNSSRGHHRGRGNQDSSRVHHRGRGNRDSRGNRNRGRDQVPMEDILQITIRDSIRLLDKDSLHSSSSSHRGSKVQQIILVGTNKN